MLFIKFCSRFQYPVFTEVNWLPSSSINKTTWIGKVRKLRLKPQTVVARERLPIVLSWHGRSKLATNSTREWALARAWESANNHTFAWEKGSMTTKLPLLIAPIFLVLLCMMRVCFSSYNIFRMILTILCWDQKHDFGVFDRQNFNQKHHHSPLCDCLAYLRKSASFENISFFLNWQRISAGQRYEGKVKLTL